MALFNRGTPAPDDSGLDTLLQTARVPVAGPPPDDGAVPATAPAAPANGSAAEAAPVQGRLGRLAGVVDRSKRTRNRKDVRKLMNALGMVAIGLGVMTVILGWYGASHSPYLYQEIPYLISGGLLGLALVFAGGVLVTCGWSLRQIQESHRNTQALVRSVEHLERTLRVTMAANAAGSAPGNGSASSANTPPASSVPATPATRVGAR